MRALRQAGRGGDLVHEEVDELGHVLAPLGQGRHPDRHDAEAVEQVLAEAPFGDLDAEVARRRGDDAHVDMDPRGAADALEVLVDEHAQDAVLGLARHVGDLVDVERAAMRLLERADAAAARPPPASMPKSSASMFSGVIVAALMTTNGPLARADSACMVRARQLLAGARRAGDHDAGVGRRHPLDRLAELVDGRRMADDPARLDGTGAQIPDLALEARGLERALGDEHQPVGLERLLDEVVGAAP